MELTQALMHMTEIKGPKLHPSMKINTNRSSFKCYDETQRFVDLVTWGNVYFALKLA